MKKATFIIIIFVLPFFIWSCRSSKTDIQPIDTQEIEAHIRFLSDDLLEGRGIGSKGLSIAALYQENFFRGLGLEPLFNGSYRQSFELKGSLPDKKATLEIISEEETISLSIMDDFVINSYREDCPVGVEGELVYCGYLIQAPEKNWDDIKDANLNNKVLLVEVNEPGNHPGGIFEGEDMTLYGRWTYKMEKASELGATGILLIHNTKGASYGWSVVQNSWSGEAFFLPTKKTHLFYQGWIHRDAADSILSYSGLNRESLLMKAELRDFEPVPLGLSIRVRQKSSFRTVETENIGALLKGKHRHNEGKYIILSAHYDHLGKDTSLKGDQIYNGAVDNCSASATLLSLARYYSQIPDRVKVNLAFVSVSAEEEGLLGSEYFANHLPFARSSVLGNINFEMTNVWGKTEEVYAIGAKYSDLDDYCKEAAENLKWEYIPERGGKSGFFFRSDQFSFVKAGIPAVWLHEGITSKGKDKDFIKRKRQDYINNKYHKVEDEIGIDWDLLGTVQIASWAKEIISLLSESETLPRFKLSCPFQR